MGSQMSLTVLNCTQLDFLHAEIEQHANYERVV